MENFMLFTKNARQTFPQYGQQDFQFIQQNRTMEGYSQGNNTMTERDSIIQMKGTDLPHGGMTSSNPGTPQRKIHLQEDETRASRYQNHEEVESAQPQQFHHPHFHHHHRHSTTSMSGAYTLRQSPRSMSVNEGSEQGSNSSSHCSRYPTKTSYSLDGSATFIDTEPSSRTGPSSGKWNVAVTDLDQAMQELDEVRLRSLFGDQMLSNISFGYTPNSYGTKLEYKEQGDETNLDDPVNVTYVSNINVSKLEGRALEKNSQVQSGEKYTPNVNLDDAVKHPVDLPHKLRFSHSEVFDGKSSACNHHNIQC